MSISYEFCLFYGPETISDYRINLFVTFFICFDTKVFNFLSKSSIFYVSHQLCLHYKKNTANASFIDTKNPKFK